MVKVCNQEKDLDVYKGRKRLKKVNREKKMREIFRRGIIYMHGRCVSQTKTHPRTANHAHFKITPVTFGVFIPVILRKLTWYR